MILNDKHSFNLTIYSHVFSSLLFFILDYRPQFTIATAMVYFHRFFARKDFEDYDRYVCLSLSLSSPNMFINL
jgi:hypothetical protein